MEENNDIESPKENISKIRDIHSNFKNAKRLSPLKPPDVKKKKSVMFLEPPKEFNADKIKKTHIVKNRKAPPNFQTQINFSKKRKSKNNLKTIKIKSDRNNSFRKMPKLKTKVVNINKHYYMPIITKYNPSTIISNKKENVINNKNNIPNYKNYKRMNTTERNIKKTEEFNNNIKKLDIKSYKKNRKSQKNIKTGYNDFLFDDDIKEKKNYERKNYKSIIANQKKSIIQFDNSYNEINEDKKDEDNNDKFKNEKNNYEVKDNEEKDNDDSYIEYNNKTNYNIEENKEKTEKSVKS